MNLQIVYHQTRRFIFSKCNPLCKMASPSNIVYFISSLSGRPILSSSLSTCSTYRTNKPPRGSISPSTSSTSIPSTSSIPTLTTSSSGSEALSFATDEKGVQLIYRKHGNPLEVLELVNCPRPPSLAPPAAGAPVLAHNRSDAVLIKMLASPIHPADINLITGTYPYKPPSFPVVGGYDGVAQVLEVGQSVAGIKKGTLLYSSSTTRNDVQTV